MADNEKQEEKQEQRGVVLEPQAMALVVAPLADGGLSIQLFRGGNEVPEEIEGILYGIAWGIANDQKAIIELNEKAYKASLSATDINNSQGSA